MKDLSKALTFFLVNCSVLSLFTIFSKFESEYEEYLKHIENSLVQDIEDGSKEIRDMIIEEDEKMKRAKGFNY